MSLTIGLATRGRPALLRKTLDRTLPNVRRGDTRLIVLADEDDREMDGFQYGGVEIERLPRPDSVGEKWNHAVKVAPADVYMSMCDYVAHVTPGFDEKILEAASVFPDGVGVVYNHMANLSFPFLNAVTHGYVEKTGGMYPEIFPYWFVDHWLDDIARMIDRIAVADVAVHLDFKPQTQSMREPAFWATVYDATTMDRRRIAHSIIDSPDFIESDWRKRILKSHHPLIEERSLMVNSIVKGLPAGDKSTDERYERIRGKAVEIIKARIAEMEAA